MSEGVAQRFTRDVQHVVDPGRAFGTGGHATTRLCLELLDGVERGSLLDVGCGSGVLAIAAARLGFGPVLALDHDPAALEATKRNAAANGVELDAQVVQIGDGDDVALRAAVADEAGRDELADLHVALEHRRGDRRAASRRS